MRLSVTRLVPPVDAFISNTTGATSGGPEFIRVFVVFVLLAKNTDFIVFGLTRPGLKPTIYRTDDIVELVQTDTSRDQGNVSYCTGCLNTRVFF
jgi:hypothetical protein